MKHHIKAWIVLLAALASFILAEPCQAQADSLSEWNRSCRTKTAQATPVYARNDYYMERMPVLTLPANTYVKIGSSVNEIAVISYMTADGISGSGYVRRNDLTYAVVHFIDADGLNHAMQELQYWDLYETYPPPGGSAVNGYEPEGYVSSSSGKIPETEKAEDSPADTPVPKPADNFPSNIPSSAATPAPEFTASFTVMRAGFATCTIRRGGQDEEVPSHELIFSPDVPNNRKIAYIYAPNSGFCWMREKPSANGRTVRQCKAGTVVIVLEAGAEWTKVRYREFEGYVLTRCLRFSDGKADVMGTGVLTYNGYSNGSTSINVRNAPDREAVKIAEWKTGTEVTVFSLNNGWYEIEHRGLHGFVMENYLTMTD